VAAAARRILGQPYYGETMIRLRDLVYAEIF